MVCKPQALLHTVWACGGCYKDIEPTWWLEKGVIAQLFADGHSFKDVIAMNDVAHETANESTTVQLQPPQSPASTQGRPHKDSSSTESDVNEEPKRKRAMR